MRKLGASAVVLAAMLAFGVSSASGSVVWLCKPGIAKNPCEIPQDTTVQSSAIKGTVVTPPQGHGRSTASTSIPRSRTTPRSTPTSPAIRSSSRSRSTRPRGSTSSAESTRRSTGRHARGPHAGASDQPSTGESLANGTKPFDDVVEAWRDYLAKYNNGRGVVLIGHSQGTRMLRELITKEIELKPEQHRLLVAASCWGATSRSRPAARSAATSRSRPCAPSPGSSDASSPTRRSPRTRPRRHGTDTHPQAWRSPAPTRARWQA